MSALPKFNDYLVFADEAGDHSLCPLDKDFPLFVLAFCVIERYHYADFVVPQMLRLKLKYFPDTHAILHERDIRRGEGDFSFLTKKTVREEFFTDLNAIIERAQFKIIASVIRKEVLLNNYKSSKDIYSAGVAFGLKKLSDLLKLQKPEQIDQSSSTTIAFEARGKKEDAELEAAFSCIVQNHMYEAFGKRKDTELEAPFLHIARSSTHYEQFRIKILPKISNCCGLQLADLVARPIGRHLLKPDQPNKAYDIIREKIGDPRGGNCGFQIF